MTATLLARVVDVLETQHIPFSVSLPIVRAEDLILLELYAGGIQDRWDIQQLLITAGAGLTLGDIDARVLSLPERCQALWAQLRPST